jgi:hypothetical protein
MDEPKLLAEQLAYYRARAGEYDQWFLRESRYDRGPEHRAEWFREVAVVEAGLREAGPRGHRASGSTAPAPCWRRPASAGLGSRRRVHERQGRVARTLDGDHQNDPLGWVVAERKRLAGVLA